MTEYPQPPLSRYSGRPLTKNSGQLKEEDMQCSDIIIDSENVSLCGYYPKDKKYLKIVSGDKIIELFEYFRKEHDISKKVSKINIYLSESSEIYAKLEGRKDPETGELLTAYGFEFENGVLDIPVYVKSEYLDNLDNDYLDKAVGGSIWYFLSGNKYWNDVENFGPKVIREYYNSLGEYEKIVEVS